MAAERMEVVFNEEGFFFFAREGEKQNKSITG